MFNDSWQFNRSRKKSEKFLEGAIDLHVHPGPHLFSSPRSTDPIKTAVEARDAGMRALMLACKAPLAPYYEKFGFALLGASASAHGGASWLDMALALRRE